MAATDDRTGSDDPVCSHPRVVRRPGLINRTWGSRIDVDNARSWLAAAADRTILRRSLVTCLIVGSLVTVINHSDELIQGNLDTNLGWQVGLTFLVPFVVATISGAAAIRSRVELPREDGERQAARDARDGETGDESPATLRD